MNDLSFRPSRTADASSGGYGGGSATLGNDFDSKNRHEVGTPSATRRQCQGRRRVTCRFLNPAWSPHFYHELGFIVSSFRLRCTILDLEWTLGKRKSPALITTKFAVFPNWIIVSVRDRRERLRSLGPLQLEAAMASSDALSARRTERGSPPVAYEKLVLVHSAAGQPVVEAGRGREYAGGEGISGAGVVKEGVTETAKGGTADATIARGMEPAFCLGTRRLLLKLDEALDGTTLKT
ncbi:hypothetical protein B0H11DRAFT_1908996 [Mycena galericulata]|nr:hypothetical protein B0H11DRAFT_1908996 [Mycena galericulata]